MLHESRTVSTRVGIDDPAGWAMFSRSGTGKTGAVERLAVQVLRLFPRLLPQNVPGRRQTGRAGFDVQHRY